MKKIILSIFIISSILVGCTSESTNESENNKPEEVIPTKEIEVTFNHYYNANNYDEKIVILTINTETDEVIKVTGVKGYISKTNELDLSPESANRSLYVYEMYSLVYEKYKEGVIPLEINFIESK